VRSQLVREVVRQHYKCFTTAAKVLIGTCVSFCVSKVLQSLTSRGAKYDKGRHGPLINADVSGRSRMVSNGPEGRGDSGSFSFCNVNCGPRSSASVRVRQRTY
jgi:hypothetical protein